MKAPMFVLIKTVKAQEVRHAFGLSDGSSRGENGNDGTPNLNVLRASEGFECKLGEIRAEADLPFPVRYHRLCVGFLGFR